ncbi:MAG: hypothetical protein JSR83_21040 [Proteobacteria bacterium]|nr:hypothetical protein [Pseudomonadota bacterium]
MRSNYDENVAPGAAPSRSSQWFEETLCQTASLFTLKRLAQRWESTPPGPEWVGEAATLRRCFELLISEGHRQLPPNVPLYRNVPEEHRALVGDVLAMLKLGNDLRAAAVHLGRTP